MDSYSGGRLILIEDFHLTPLRKKKGKTALFLHKRAHYDSKNKCWRKVKAIETSNAESDSEYLSGNHSI